MPKRNRQPEKKPRSWFRDDDNDNPNLLLPEPALPDSDEESRYRDYKYEKRFKDFKNDQANKNKAALAKNAEAKDALEFDDRVGLEGVDKNQEPPEKPVIPREFDNEPIAFDYETGKLVMRRPLMPRWFVDYNLFRPDDTIVLNGKRRTGKSYLMRKILFEMRHCFSGGLVFTATKHNGACWPVADYIRRSFPVDANVYAH